MSTKNVPYGVEFTCDCCGDTWDPPRPPKGFLPRDFAECLEMAKEEGWKPVQVRSKTGRNEWEHRCGGCA